MLFLVWEMKRRNVSRKEDRTSLFFEKPERKVYVDVEETVFGSGRECGIGPS